MSRRILKSETSPGQNSVRSTDLSIRQDSVSQICMDAAMKMISEQGYGALTVEAIAKITGIAKTTIYRRWKSKGELILDALLHSSERNIKPANSVSPAQDIKSFIIQTCDLVEKNNLGSSLAAVVAEAQLDGDFAEQLWHRFIKKRRGVLSEIIERGKAAGELRADCDTEIVMDIIYGAFWYRVLTNRSPLSRKFAKTLVDQILQGIRQK